MATNLALATMDRRTPPAVSQALVTEYKSAHEEMLMAITDMDVLTGGPRPSHLRSSYTRLRITRASAECRAAFGKIVSNVSRERSPIVSHVINRLETEHRKAREAAKRHMSTWTHEAALQDWAGYCQSSAEVRALWRELIELERELLYPLL